MSEFVKAQIIGATKVLDSTVVAAVDDFRSGIGSFFSGEHAQTHEPRLVEEFGGEKKPATATEREGLLDTGLKADEQTAGNSKAPAQATQVTLEADKEGSSYGR